MPTEPRVELGCAHRVIFDAKVEMGILYDVIVIGSDMAGETVADFASVQDMNVSFVGGRGHAFPDEPAATTCRAGSVLRRPPRVQPRRSLAFLGRLIPRMTSLELDFGPRG